MRPVWRPERRNRNIGQSWSGYSQFNDMRVPESWKDKHGNVSAFYERLNFVEEQLVTFGDAECAILYENPSEGFSYGCGPCDVTTVLKALDGILPAFPDIIAFRQPTRKQQQQQSAWGRFVYFAQIGSHSGSAVILEAQELGTKIRWSKRMSVDDRAEYGRLVADGHVFVETKRHFETVLVEEAVRNTKLYRTLLHELGHWAHYQQDVVDGRTALDEDNEVAQDLYFARPRSEREVFAHAFADKLSTVLRENGVIPFDP